jgi:putative membrane protein
MISLTESQKDAIRDAIREAESHTSGELVAVLARASDAYHYIPVLWAALVALLTPAAILLAVDTFGLWYSPSLTGTYLVQVLVFLAGVGVFGFSPLKMMLIPKAVKRMRASRLAHEQFHFQGLGDTERGTGVLLFVSFAERYVEIIADRKIHERVEEGAWDHIIADFVADVAAGRVSEGFLTAIEACGKLLGQHFPHHDGDVDELPNHLIEI